MGRVVFPPWNEGPNFGSYHMILAFSVSDLLYAVCQTLGLEWYDWDEERDFVVQLLSHVQLFCNPRDCSPPASSVRGLFQAKLLE